MEKYLDFRKLEDLYKVVCVQGFVVTTADDKQIHIKSGSCGGLVEQPDLIDQSRGRIWIYDGTRITGETSISCAESCLIQKAIISNSEIDADHIAISAQHGLSTINSKLIIQDSVLTGFETKIHGKPYIYAAILDGSCDVEDDAYVVGSILTDCYVKDCAAVLHSEADMSMFAGRSFTHQCILNDCKVDGNAHLERIRAEHRTLAQRVIGGGS